MSRATTYSQVVELIRMEKTPRQVLDDQFWEQLAGKLELIRSLYDAIVGPGAGKGLGWVPMLCEIIRLTRGVKKNKG